MATYGSAPTVSYKAATYAQNGITPAQRPDIKPFEFSQETLMYPQYLRQLGEMTAQRGFEQGQRTLGLGNAAQSYQGLQNQANLQRMGAYSQAGQAQLGVDVARANAMNDYYANLMRLYGMDISRTSGGTGNISIGGHTGGGGGGGYIRMGSGSGYGGTYTTPFGPGGSSGPVYNQSGQATSLA